MSTQTTVTVVVFLYISNVLLCTKGDFNCTKGYFNDLYREKCFNFSTVVIRMSITDQRRLDELLQNRTIFSNSSDRIVSKCIHLSFCGNTSFQLDLLQLMTVNLGPNGSLVMTGDRSVILNCTDNATDLDPEELDPISRALLVLFDGLVFTRCPVPIMMEEVAHVIIKNCVFL